MLAAALERYFVIRDPIVLTSSDGSIRMNSVDLWKNGYFLGALAAFSWLFCFSTNVVFVSTFGVSVPQTVTYFGHTFTAELCQNHWMSSYKFLNAFAEFIVSIHLWSVPHIYPT